MGEAQGPSHAFFERDGQLRLLLRGDSLGALVAEAARALGDRPRGGVRSGEGGHWPEVELVPERREKLLMNWLNRLLVLSARNRWAPVDCELISVHDDLLHAPVRGIALAREAVLGRADVPEAFASPVGGGVQAEVVLGPSSRAHGRRALPAGDG
jgi:SHS2 domain-containing protein